MAVQLNSKPFPVQNSNLTSREFVREISRGSMAYIRHPRPKLQVSYQAPFSILVLAFAPIPLVPLLARREHLPLMKRSVSYKHRVPSRSASLYRLPISFSLCTIPACCTFSSSSLDFVLTKMAKAS